ncbi:MAG: DUF2497 domain-containing protein [Holosporales bacterium]|jgi:hypothetical protein|nr:DUF2497 domain-containing protein [Holosporales bacterium]
MNFSGGNNRGNGNKRGDEMSMEDILSSIRKYVSEDGLPRNEGSGEKDDDNSDHVSDDQDPALNVINLGMDHVVGHSASPATPNIGSHRNQGDSLRFSEQSDLSEEVITIPQQPSLKQRSGPGPFDKLTDALRSYGKNRPKDGEKTEMETVFGFVRSIVEEKVDKWIEDHMQSTVEEAVLREIERIKAEG